MREMKLGTPPKMLGKIFAWALKKFALWWDYSPQKGGNYSNIFEIMWAKSMNFLQVPLEIFPQAFWRGTQRNFPHFHS